MHQLFHECVLAVDNKQQKSNSKNVFISKTETGIDVEIISINGMMKSIYPVLENKHINYLSKNPIFTLWT